ncbi:hypothetical protein NIES2101_36990 [Calothrix sp. HK-06]|nr:hypothetical protein NIES2101_36990 [Calothrix sp. HK-06]
MTVCNVVFKRTPKYEEILDKLMGGANVYLQGATCTGKSTLVRELQFDLETRYVYVSVPRDANYSVLYKVCESIAAQLNIEVESKCVGGVSPEGTLQAIKQLEERVLFVFDEVGNIQNCHPDAIKGINKWLHDLSMVDGCQVVVASQTTLDKALPHFFANKSWRNVFDIVSLDDVSADCESVDIKLAMQQWMKRELLKGKYTESFLKLISMGINGELELLDAIRAASSVEYYNINVR